MIFFRKVVPTFRNHALALPVRGPQVLCDTIDQFCNAAIMSTIIIRLR